MTILSIETSTRVCSAAWSQDGITQKQLINKTDGQHARQLPLFIEELLSDIRNNELSLDAVAISAGPGSYTGLRIATATAKGLCYALNIPLIAIDTLQIMAGNGSQNGTQVSTLADGTQVSTPAENNQNETASNTILCPMIDARRMEVYTALYDSEGKRLTDIEAKVIEQNSFSEELASGKILFFGDGADKCKSVITHKNAVFIDGFAPEAGYMAVLAKQKFEQHDFADTAYFEPFYLKEYNAVKSKNKVLN